MHETYFWCQLWMQVACQFRSRIAIKGPSPTVNHPPLAEITKPKVDLEIKKVSHSRIPRPGNYKDVYGLSRVILEIYNMVIYPSMKVMRSVRQIVRNVQNVRNCPAHIRYVRIIIRYRKHFTCQNRIHLKLGLRKNVTILTIYDKTWQFSQLMSTTGFWNCSSVYVQRRGASVPTWCSIWDVSRMKANI